MMRSTQKAFRLAAGLSLAAASASAAPGRITLPARYDGTWTVEIVTEAGACDRAYRYPVRVENGQARFIGTAFTVSGQVARNGMIRGSISSGLATATVVGKLSANGQGRGTWVASGPLECRGHWNAARRS